MAQGHNRMGPGQMTSDGVPIGPGDRVIVVKANKLQQKQDSEKRRKAKLAEIITEICNALPSDMVKYKTQGEILNAALKFIQATKEGYGDSLINMSVRDLKSQNLDLSNQVQFLKAELQRSKNAQANGRRLIPVSVVQEFPKSPAPQSSTMTKAGMQDATTETDEVTQVIQIQPPPTTSTPAAKPVPHTVTVNNYSYVIINTDTGGRRAPSSRRSAITTPIVSLAPVPIAPKDAINAVQALDGTATPQSSTLSVTTSPAPAPPPSDLVRIEPLKKTLMSVKTQTVESSLPPKTHSPMPASEPAVAPIMAPSPPPMNIIAPLSPQFSLGHEQATEKAASSSSTDKQTTGRVTDVNIATPPPPAPVPVAAAPMALEQHNKFSVPNFLSNDNNSRQKNKTEATKKRKSSAGVRREEKTTTSAYAEAAVNSQPNTVQYEHAYAPQLSQAPPPVYGVYTGLPSEDTTSDLTLSYETAGQGSLDELWNQGYQYTAVDYVPNAMNAWTAHSTAHSTAVSAAATSAAGSCSQSNYLLPQTTATGVADAHGYSLYLSGTQKDPSTSSLSTTAAHSSSSNLAFQLSAARPPPLAKHAATFNIASVLHDGSRESSLLKSPRKRPAHALSQPSISRLAAQGPPRLARAPRELGSQEHGHPYTAAQAHTLPPSLSGLASTHLPHPSFHFPFSTHQSN